MAFWPDEGYLRQFQRILNGWNILGRARDLRVRNEQPHVLAFDDDESTDEEKYTLAVNCYTVCQQLVPEWANAGITIDDVAIDQVTGGLTNKLTKVSLKPEVLKRTGVSPSCVLVRHYGVGTENFFDRDNEHKIFEEFSRKELGPRLYGFFDGGRIEQFMSARNIRGWPEIRQYLSTIGETMAAMHLCEMDIPKNPMVFENLFQWLKTARDTVKFPETETRKQELYNLFDFVALHEELCRLKDRLEALNSPVCFCHNDLLAGNMMLDEDTKEIFFIDYEYGSYNYRGFDFGNFFCECTIDYSVQEHPKFRFIQENYPTEEQQRCLFAAYIHRKKKLQGLSNVLPKESEIRQIMKESNEFALAASLIWCFWGMIQSATSEIDFGYLEFAHARLGEYHRLKDLMDNNKGMENSTALKTS